MHAYSEQEHIADCVTVQIQDYFHTFWYSTIPTIFIHTVREAIILSSQTNKKWIFPSYVWRMYAFAGTLSSSFIVFVFSLKSNIVRLSRRIIILQWVDSHESPSFIRLFNHWIDKIYTFIIHLFQQFMNWLYGQCRHSVQTLAIISLTGNFWRLSLFWHSGWMCCK